MAKGNHTVCKKWKALEVKEQYRNRNQPKIKNRKRAKWDGILKNNNHRYNSP